MRKTLLTVAIVGSLAVGGLLATTRVATAAEAPAPAPIT